MIGQAIHTIVPQTQDIHGLQYGCLFIIVFIDIIPQNQVQRYFFVLCLTGQSKIISRPLPFQRPVSK